MVVHIDSNNMPILKNTPIFGFMVVLSLCTNPLWASASQTNDASQQHWQNVTPNLSIGGSSRFRYENKQNFKFGAATASNSQDYVLQQLRLHMLWKASSHVDMFVEIQDARIYQAFHHHVINNRKTPNIFEGHADVHQAYVDFKDTHGNWLRMGRQKFNLGAQRMVASLEWVNTARVWGGIIRTGKPGRPLTTLKEGLRVRVKNKGSQSHKRGSKRTKVQAPQKEHPDTKQDIENKDVHANHVEAFNAALRRKVPAFRRKTNTYAKDTDPLQVRLDVHWILHNFVRKHFTTKQVPAVSLGILEKAFSVTDIFKMQMTAARA